MSFYQEWLELLELLEMLLVEFVTRLQVEFHQDELVAARSVVEWLELLVLPALALEFRRLVQQLVVLHPHVQGLRRFLHRQRWRRQLVVQLELLRLLELELERVTKLFEALEPILKPELLLSVR
jgi:hypothetical protein